MAFCSSNGCILNRVSIVPETTGAKLLIGFFSCSHQPEAIFTPAQLYAVQNEIMFLIRKYNDARRASQNVMGGHLAVQEIKCVNLNNTRGYWERRSIRYRPAANATVPRYNIQHPHSSGQQNIPNVSTEAQSSSNGATAHPPGSNESESPPVLFPYFSVPSKDPSPYLDISFKDIYKKAGFIGISKIASLDNLSEELSNPLGCCFDEKLNNWVIADAGNGRIMFFPGGFRITSKQNKLKNIRDVCIIEHGKTLAVLSESVLGTVNYNEGLLSIIKEGDNLPCRGLARTPLGHVATIERIGNSCYIILYKVTPGDYGKVHSAISICSDPVAIPSFVAVNGNRLVVTDIARETITMAVFSSDEKAAKIRQRRPVFPSGRNGQPSTFQFVSAVQMDRNGWSLIADTSCHSLQLFDEKLNFVANVGSNYAFPFIKSLCVNNSGKVLIIGRGGNELAVSNIIPAQCFPSF